MIFVLLLHFVINCVRGGRNSWLASHSVSIPEGETAVWIFHTELFSRPSTSPPRIILIMPPPELPDIMQALQHAGHKFQTVSFNSWKFAGSQARIKKECSVCFSVDTVVTSQDIVVGFDKAGIDIDNIVSIQRKASNNTWIVSFNSKVARDDALNQPNVKIAGCMVFLGDCENRVSIVKVYELPVELPDSVVIGRLSHYGKVYSFRRDRLAERIFNGVRTARMIIDKPIPSQAFIAGEFARFWYPSQPKTCRKCGAEGHLAAACSSQRCFNCEQSGHRSDECPLPPLCRVCLAETHSTRRCPFIYYSSNISMAEAPAVSYAKGRTIRKVMGGRGIFELQEFFFAIRFFAWILFRPLHEYFLGLIGVHKFFSFNFPLSEYFFVYFARTPHNFSNGPSLIVLNR